ncbi:hypothetical protein NP493_941g01017 [Ridgeia piscesae]|uniref:Nucleoplasmin core domain-containing protein n=1 Tax=Ridgeia piscesae TaxID=27915 RepID=A0AAD9KJ67_RIDPI|nr:hypothetical protein NP493_941g01017 [Ridgeia piscesae]
MNGSLSHVRHNAEAAKEYFWGCKLTKDKPEQMWAPAKKEEEEEEEEDDDFVQETLFLRQAVLDVGAVKGERNVIQVKIKRFQGKAEVVTTIASLTLGNNDMCSLNVNFSHDIPATFTLVEGNGPVCLVGQHLVEFAEDYDDLDMTEGELSEANDSFKKITTGKRKASNSLSSKNKRGKTDGKAENGGDDDEDDEDEEEDPDSAEEEDDDDDASDIDDDEDEEMEDDSPKKKKKVAAKNGKPKAKTNGTTPEAAKKNKAAIKKPAARKPSKKAVK